jgi:hypothetical protein
LPFVVHRVLLWLLVNYYLRTNIFFKNIRWSS